MRERDEALVRRSICSGLEEVLADHAQKGADWMTFEPEEERSTDNAAMLYNIP
ncbi:hypothetical protein KNP414_04963 [Paenibacillus mucilaginosus KNP414]|nr:hypothetical protein KNP414_04963 [Paenibacillus mucilaginosus KNP414]